MNIELIIYSSLFLFIMFLVFDRFRLKNKVKSQASKIKGLEGVKETKGKVNRRKKAIKEAVEDIDNAEKSDIDSQFKP